VPPARSPHRFAAVIFLATSLAVGARAMLASLVGAYFGAPRQVISKDIAHAAARLEGLLGPEGSVFYLGRNPEGLWTSGLWERAAYPRTVLYIDVADPNWRSQYTSARDRYDIHYAIVGQDLPPGLRAERRWQLGGRAFLVELRR
jgi:hypothetical protein